MRVLDLYCGAGGVGVSLDRLDIPHLGIDRKDFSDTYPGEFVQADASAPPLGRDSFELVWASPPCLAYSSMSYANKNRLGFDDPREYYPTIDELNVREVCQRLGDHYIIENVRTCEDLRDPTKLNGFALGYEFEIERHFETSFPVPDALADGLTRDDLYTQEGSGHRSYLNLADAKDIPRWNKKAVRNAIPPRYVQYLLHYAPGFDVPLPDDCSQKQEVLL
jgi:hypothetical protein